ncbi:uncharacterized protein [Halyomorpha halys]|uniref:uncharacterized protein n=1 Tax=Halyomorpha halys TaxID=286706 RepID=UPI0006D50EC8|nr:uncharacterized protein LOC106682594 [Halyomorpha halys]
MKAVFGLFLLVAASSAYVIGDVPLLGNSLDDLITEALEYVRSLLKKHDPYTIPPMPDQHLVDTDIDFTIATHDVKVSNAGDFTIDKISNNIPLLMASFAVSVPTAHITGNYKISGTAFQKKVEGEGTFVLDVTKLVESGDIHFGFVDHSLQITTLNLDYSIEGIQTTITGLTIECMTQEEIEDMLNKQFLTYLNNNKPFVTGKVGNHVKEIANALIKGKSLNEIIQWLKQLVSSTTDPLPFTFLPLM